MSDASIQVAGILFALIPTVGIAGHLLLYFNKHRVPGSMDNPTRRAIFVAEHAEVGTGQ